MDKRPIGVFDSGLGGLTAVKRLMEVLPGEDIIYFGDTGRVPYGGRSRETIIRYARQDIAFLRRSDIKAVMAACGTVSTNGLDEIAAKSDIPVFGVVESAAAAAVAATKNGRIGLIGTAASVRSGAYDRKIKELRPNVEILKTACPLFVPLVENGKVSRDDKVLRLVAEEYLAPLREAGADTLIMGCTHYPIIRDVIADVMGDSVALIDTAAETAVRIAGYLRDNGMLSGNESGGKYKYFVSDSTEDFGRMAALFLNTDVRGSVEQISLEDF